MASNAVLLVDFMYLWNRIYYATQNQEINYFEHMLKIVEKIHYNTKYTKKYIVLDGENGTQRQKSLLPAYKEGRESKKEVYARINEFVKRCAGNYSDINFVRAQDFEADEIIACLSYVFSEKGYDVTIYSGDKDLLQLLVYPKIQVGVKYTGNFEIQPYTDSELQQKMNTISNNVITKVGDILKFRIFRGDTSDRIPAAIPRLPSKTIKHIIEESWKGVTPLSEDILDDMEQLLSDKDRKKFSENRLNIFRNWELMQLQFLPYKDIMKKINRLT